MQPMPLYIIRQNSQPLPEALFSPTDPLCRVLTLSLDSQQDSVLEDREHMSLPGTAFSCEKGDDVSYDRILEIVLTAKHVLVL